MKALRSFPGPAGATGRHGFALAAVIVLAACSTSGAAPAPVTAPTVQGAAAAASTQDVPAAPAARGATAAAPGGHASATDVARGGQLAALADCAGCHTAPGKPAFSGGVALNSDFGTIWSTNITPDQATGIGRYSDDDFDRAVREGIAQDGRRLYPAMPYTSFSRMSRDDTRALFAYFRQSVAPVATPQAQRTDLRFPYDQRWGLRLWNWIFAPDIPFAADPGHDEAWNRGAWIVQGPGHCGECHTARGWFGQSRSYRRGDAEFLAGGSVGGWAAPSLRGAGGGTGAGAGAASGAGAGSTAAGRSTTGGTGSGSSSGVADAAAGGAAAAPAVAHDVRAWSRDELVRYLQTGRNAHGSVSGEMSLVVAHSLSRLDDADVQAIAAFLASLTPGASPEPVRPDAGAAARTASSLRAGSYGVDGGERLYMDNCAACHFGSGQGAPDVFPPLAGNSLVVAADPTAVIDIVLAGQGLPSTPKAPGRLRMPGFGWRLGDDEIARLATFVRSAWGNGRPAVTAAQVAARRQQLGSVAALAPVQPYGADAPAPAR